MSRAIGEHQDQRLRQFDPMVDPQFVTGMSDHKRRPM